MLLKNMRTILHNLGLTQQKAADRLGITQGALNLYLSGKRQVRTGFIAKFCQEFNIPITQLYTGAMPISPVSVIGFVEADTWQQPNQWVGQDLYQIMPPIMPEMLKNMRFCDSACADSSSTHSGYPSGIFALEVRGDSMNCLYPNGTCVLCTSLHDYPHPLTSGKRVVCQRKKSDGSIEATIKEYTERLDGIYLVPKTTDSHFKEFKFSNSSDELAILAVVVGSYHPE